MTEFLLEMGLGGVVLVVAVLLAGSTCDQPAEDIGKLLHEVVQQAKLIATNSCNASLPVARGYAYVCEVQVPVVFLATSVNTAAVTTPQTPQDAFAAFNRSDTFGSVDAPNVFSTDTFTTASGGVQLSLITSTQARGPGLTAALSRLSRFFQHDGLLKHFEDEGIERAYSLRVDSAYCSRILTLHNVKRLSCHEWRDSVLALVFLSF